MATVHWVEHMCVQTVTNTLNISCEIGNNKTEHKVDELFEVSSKGYVLPYSTVYMTCSYHDPRDLGNASP